MLKALWHLPRNTAIFLLRAYQRFFSPDHSFWSRWVFPGGHCKYRPSCSEYGILAYRKHGFLNGTRKTLWRLLRCNPWSKGGWDLP